MVNQFIMRPIHTADCKGISWMVNMGIIYNMTEKVCLLHYIQTAPRAAQGVSHRDHSYALPISDLWIYKRGFAVLANGA